jgi:solute carrier family 50 protein (sugar transporter)
MSIPLWVTTLLAPIIGDVVGTCMWLSTWPAVARAKEAGSLGVVNPLPFVAMVLNCTGWVAYAYVNGGAAGHLIFVGNAPGVLLGTYYVLSAVMLMDPGPERERVGNLFTAALAFWSVVGWFVTCVPVGVDNARDIVGVAGCCALCVFYGAPLSVLAKVIRTRDSSSISGPLAVASLCCGFMWSVFGFATADPYLAIPNSFGVVLSLTQLGLRAGLPRSDVSGAAQSTKDLGARQSASQAYAKELDRDAKIKQDLHEPRESASAQYALELREAEGVS